MARQSVPVRQAAGVPNLAIPVHQEFDRPRHCRVIRGSRILADLLVALSPEDLHQDFVIQFVGRIELSRLGAFGRESGRADALATTETVSRRSSLATASRSLGRSARNSRHRRGRRARRPASPAYASSNGLVGPRLRLDGDRPRVEEHELIVQTQKTQRPEHGLVGQSALPV
jgi:hypothetical protein